MGNTLGFTKENVDMTKYFSPQLWKENWPSDILESPYPPLDGFPNGRKPREMIATEAEMDSAKLPLRYRDYCAHKYIDLKACIQKNIPFFWHCHHARHEYAECKFEDQVLRMKEWERERRLRQKEIDAKKAAA